MTTRRAAHLLAALVLAACTTEFETPGDTGTDTGLEDTQTDTSVHDTITDTGEEDPPPDTVTSECGDGTQDEGEECDEGDLNSNSMPNACREDCTLPHCGDGVVDDEFGEECDGDELISCLTECGDEGYALCMLEDCAVLPPCRMDMEICENGCDDDGDGQADCADPDCGCGSEICDNGIDDDGDGGTDCGDEECAGIERCPCEPDDLEPNDSITDPRIVNNGNHFGLSVCPGNNDFYRIIVGMSTTVVVQLQFSHAEGDIDLQFLHNDGGVIATSNSTDDDEQVTVSLPALGQYIIAVALYRDLGTQSGNTYDMIVSY